MSTKKVRLLSGIKSDIYGFLENNNIYELYTEDADYFIGRKLAEETTQDGHSIEEVVEKGRAFLVKELRVAKKMKEILIKTNVKTKAQREVANAGLKVYDDQIKELIGEDEEDTPEIEDDPIEKKDEKIEDLGQEEPADEKKRGRKPNWQKYPKTE